MRQCHHVLSISFLVGTLIFCLMGISQVEAATPWRATIHAEGQVVGSAVNQADVVVGVDVAADSLYRSPEPPEYTVFTKLWRQTWGGPFYRDIRQTGQPAYVWILQVDPHGNMPPPPQRCAMLSWNPNDLAAPGTYRLWEDLNLDGAGDNIVVPDMKLTTQYQVCGTGPKYFVIEFTPSSGPVISVSADSITDRASTGFS